MAASSRFLTYKTRSIHFRDDTARNPCDHLQWLQAEPVSVGGVIKGKRPGTRVPTSNVSFRHQSWPRTLIISFASPRFGSNVFVTDKHEFSEGQSQKL